MKKTNNIKLLVLAISLALLICGIVGVAVSAETASEPAANADASLSIYKKNVSFQNAPQLVFAVAYENLDPATVTLDVWYGEKSGDAQNVTSFGNVTVDGKTYLGFAVEPADPKDIDKLVYVQAKAGKILSDVERYSILEFAWSGIMTSETDEAAADFYNIIDYSASVQKWLTASGKFNGTPVGNYFYVKAESVALDESGYDSGVFTAPVTFTLGESELGWSVTTYVDGVKTTETKAAGSEITASASTICTPIETPEAVKPQDVEGTPVDFENLTAPANGNVGENTTFFVGSTLTTTKKGITETTDKNGNTTKAYYFDSDSAEEKLRIQSLGDDVKAANLTGANAYIFESDMKIDFASAANSTVKIYLGTTNTDKSYAYYHTMRLDTTTGTIKFLDAGAGGAGGWATSNVKSGDWFNLRLEYYKISADEMLVLTFVDGELIYVSNRPNETNANGDDAWPVYDASFTAGNGTAADGINAIFFVPLAATDATFYFDNTLLRRTTLTPPTIPVSEYDSYYTPAN